MLTIVFGSPNKKYVGEVINSFQKEGSKYNWESNQGKANTVEEFLGIEIHSFTENGNRASRMTQDGLINKIINTCSMGYCYPNTTPTTVQYPLGTDAKGNQE